MKSKLKEQVVDNMRRDHSNEAFRMLAGEFHRSAAAALVALSCILLGNVKVLAATVSGAQFGDNGNVYGDIAGTTVLRLDELQLKEGNNVIDSIDWRAKARAASVNSVVRNGVNGLFSAKVSAKQIEHGFEVTWEYGISADTARKSLGLSAHVSADTFRSLPQKPGRTIAFGPSRKATVEAEGCVYQFDLGASDVDFSFAGLEDFRHAAWWKDFRFRAMVAPLQRKSGKIVLRVTGMISEKSYAVSSAESASPFICVPVAKHGNRGLSDDVPNDGKGGWTDQGTNDLSSFQPGILRAQGIPFEIGDSVIVLKSLNRPSFPMESPAIPLNAKVERLCFCQTAAWCNGANPTVFHCRVTYADGTATDIPMTQGMEFFDWWNSSGGPNAKIAWSGNSGEHAVSLFHSQWKNPKPDVALKTLQVVSKNQSAVPVVLGITAVRGDLASPTLSAMLDCEFSATPAYAATLPKEKKDWYECQLPLLREIKENSALDASSVNHAPAGKHGFSQKGG